MSISNKKVAYKTCIVPLCTNTSASAPDKLFISLPKDLKARRLWQDAMRRTKFVSDKGSRYCCEDHFNVEEDIENYMYLKMMKTGKIKMKPFVVPHIFDCQEDRPTAHSSKSTELFKKREQQTLIENAIYEYELTKKELVFSEQESEQGAPTSKNTLDQGIQVNLKPHMRSKAIQCTSMSFASTSRPIKKRKRHKTANTANQSPQKRAQMKKYSSFDQGQSSTTDFSMSIEGST